MFVTTIIIAATDQPAAIDPPAATDQRAAVVIMAVGDGALDFKQ